YRGEPEELIETALAEGVSAVQFRYADIDETQPPRLAELVQTFRAKFDPGFLSVHLPNFLPDPDKFNLDAMATPLAWAQAVRVDDLTIHLPDALTSDLYAEEGR